MDPPQSENLTSLPVFDLRHVILLDKELNIPLDANVC